MPDKFTILDCKKVIFTFLQFIKYVETDAKYFTHSQNILIVRNLQFLPLCRNEI